MTHCIPYNPDCTVCNPPYEWPDNYKPIPPKATFDGVAMTQEAYAALTARLTVLAGALDAIANASALPGGPHGHGGPAWFQSWQQLRDIARAALGAERA